MKKRIVSLVVIACLVFGCKSGNREIKLQNENQANSIALNEIDDIQTSEGKDLIEFVKRKNGNMVTTSNKNVEIYSLPPYANNNYLTIFVVFKQENPVENMRDFVEIVNEVSDQIFNEPRKLEDKKFGIFIGLTSEGEHVCGFSMFPQIQIFSLKGFDFTLESEKADVYRKAYDTLIKEKIGKNSISEWDYFTFRSMVEIDDDVWKFIEIAGATMTFLYKLSKFDDINVILSNKDIAEKIFSVSVKGADSKQIIEIGFGVCSVWFDDANRRIMAEIAWQLPNGEIKKEREWYNGYKMPE
jgi:hypothetical protein